MQHTLETWKKNTRWRSAADELMKMWLSSSVDRTEIGISRCKTIRRLSFGRYTGTVARIDEGCSGDGNFFQHEFACGRAYLLRQPIAHGARSAAFQHYKFISVNGATKRKRVDRKMEAGSSPLTTAKYFDIYALVPWRYLLEIIIRAVVKSWTGPFLSWYLTQPTRRLCTYLYTRCL